MTLQMKVHKDKVSGFWAEIPSLPGCFSQGESIEELKENMREAVEGWLKVNQEEIKSNGEFEVMELSL